MAAVGAANEAVRRDREWAEREAAHLNAEIERAQREATEVEGRVIELQMELEEMDREDAAEAAAAAAAKRVPFQWLSRYFCGRKGK